MDKFIYFIRHGQTEYNRMRIVQGSGIDSDLNDVGKIQARQFYQYYKDRIEFDLVIHSALRRTHQTVLPFIDSGLPSLRDERINEISWGDSEGKEGSPELIQNYKETIEAWQRDDLDASLPNGESARKLHQRLNHFITDLRKRPEENILICTHGRALRCIMCIIKEQHVRHMESYHHANTGLYLIEQDLNEFIVLKENDLSHRTPLSP